MARVAPEARFSTGSGRGHEEPGKVQLSRRILHVYAKALSGLFLIAVTAGRITGNVVNVLNWDSASLEFMWYGEVPIPVQVFDSFFRPLLNGLSFMPFLLRWSRCRTLSIRLCSYSLSGCLVTTIVSSFVEWEGGGVVAERRRVFLRALINLCWYTRNPLAAVTMQKLRALGWPRTGFVCFFLFFGLTIVRVFATVVATDYTGSGYLSAFVLLTSCQDLISVVNAVVLLYESHVKQRLLNKIIDKKMAQSASRGVCFLRLGAFLTFFDAVYLFLVETYGYSVSEDRIHLSPALFLTFDNSVVLASLLILGGLIGPQDTLDPIEVMAELEHIARTQGKRIAFPGKLNRHSKHCIVSFPGKYSSEWDTAVRMVEVRSRACSLACVFLTDQGSGLGVHEDNPEDPGHCWCKALYGQLPAATYMSIVEDPGSLSAEELRFKESDASAMGQIFLQREGQSDQQWEKDKEAAKKAAKIKCEENCGRAPWGCRWFHDWKANVEQAVFLGQDLHVFYFEGMVGCGKLSWQELSNETSVKEARKHSGLGTSQTAEVAYLESSGYKFEEHDVAEFDDFMASQSENI